MKFLMGGLVPPIIVCVLFAACERREIGGAPASRPVVATVNGKPLYKSEFEAFLPEDYSRSLTAEEQRMYLDRWITTELLYEHALETGIDISADLQARLDRYKKDLISDVLVQKVIHERAVITDEEVFDYYKDHEHEFTREVRVSHILLSTPEDVEEVQQLFTKRTFSWVARRHSLDKHTGIGGDLGFLSKGNMIPEFEEVVFTMQVGEISEPIESEFGYHIIKLTDMREARNKLAYEDVAPEISRILLLDKREAVYNALISQLTEAADIRIISKQLQTIPEEEDSAGASR